MNNNIKQYLTLKYIIAISLIFCVLLFTLVIFSFQLSTAENDSYIINISGMQRMFSQRVALIAREVELSTSTNEADIYIKKMTAILNKMLSNHKQLSTGVYLNGYKSKMSKEINDLYFSDLGIDQKVKEYTNYVEEFLEVYKTQGLEVIKQGKFADKIINISYNDLLEILDKAVQLYEKEAKERINNFKLIEVLAFCFGVLILLLEVAFIFRPMTKTIVNTADELKNRNDELLEFSYRISHDVRSPIKSISGLIKLAESHNNSGNYEKLSKTLYFIKNASIKLEELTEDIIMLTKIKLLDIQEEKVDIEQLIEASIESLSFIQGFETIKIEKNFKLSGNYLIKRMYLSQIIDNLLSNAIKYQDNDKDNSFVKIEVIEEGSNCIITLIDNGIGIPDQNRTKIFKMFQRFHPRHSFGSGLGLYLVAQNAKALQGSINYSSLPEGSQFTLTFPLKKLN